MWVYQKTLEYPVNLKNSDPKMAKYIMTQLGGPNGELAAALRYLQQRYTMPTGKTRALLTDIGTEEMAHVEIISTMVYQIMENATIDEIKKAGLEDHAMVHLTGCFGFCAMGPIVTLGLDVVILNHNLALNEIIGAIIVTACVTCLTRLNAKA